VPRLTKRRQAGIALLESLIALAILAGALLGMLFVQLRTMAEAQSTTHRAQALRLIEDLAERIQSNPGGFAQLADFRSDWGPAAAGAPDCEAQWCGAAALARWDLHAWKSRVAHALPLGDAKVFDLPGEPRRALGVMIGWRADRPDGASATAPGIACPQGLLCHLGHVQP
jgi:type IV pilus assembly protein PilV